MKPDRVFMVNEARSLLLGLTGQLSLLTSITDIQKGYEEEIYPILRGR